MQVEEFNVKCVLPKHKIFDIKRVSKEYEVIVTCVCGGAKFMVEWHIHTPDGWDVDQWQRVRKSLFLALNGPAAGASDA